MEALTSLFPGSLCRMIWTSILLISRFGMVKTVTQPPRVRRQRVTPAAFHTRPTSQRNQPRSSARISTVHITDPVLTLLLSAISYMVRKSRRRFELTGTARVQERHRLLDPLPRTRARLWFVPSTMAKRERLVVQEGIKGQQVRATAV